ncbi:iron chelate uptake ABC transporter family permease subunit [Methanothrix sp.]
MRNDAGRSYRDYRTLLPASGLFMALLLLGEDRAVRIIMAPAIFPVDTITASMGAPLC